MRLPQIFQFQGWAIRYDLIQSEETTAKTKTVVFVHGTPWTSAVYRSIIDALLARRPYQILIYDLPGYGQSQVYSEAPSVVQQSAGDAKAQFSGDTSVAFQARALAALLSHVRLNQSSPAIIGHDIAGTIILRTHLIHDIPFSSMLLLDTNTVLPWGDGFYKLARSEASTFIKLPPAIYQAMLRAVIRSAVQDPRVLQSGWEDTLADPWTDTSSDSNQRQASFFRQIAQANDADVAEMLDANMYSKVSCPVKVMWGEEDQWIPREKLEQMIEKMNAGGKVVEEFVTVPAAGHLVMLDQPARVAIEVFDWLEKKL